jgi:hypothetical protein
MSFTAPAVNGTVSVFHGSENNKIICEFQDLFFRVEHQRSCQEKQDSFSGLCVPLFFEKIYHPVTGFLMR